MGGPAALWLSLALIYDKTHRAFQNLADPLV
jgi:hypothetical protein